MYKYTVFYLLIFFFQSCKQGDDAFNFLTYQDAYGSHLTYTPDSIDKLLLLIPHYEYADTAKSNEELTQIAVEYLRNWKTFADTNQCLLVAPVLGTSDFVGYRYLFGRKKDAADYISQIVYNINLEHFPNFPKKVYLYGHGAGAEFTTRYTLAHPNKVISAIVTAPTTYSFPTPHVDYPYGMKPSIRTIDFSGTATTGKSEEQAADGIYIPNPINWLTAATTVPIEIIIGANDTDNLESESAQLGNTRTARAGNWMDKMNTFSLSNLQKPALINIHRVDEVGYDAIDLMPKAQEVLLNKMNTPTTKKKNFEGAPY